MEETPTPEIVETVVAPEELAGVPDGTVLITPADVPDEVVVYDRDTEGNVIGWHKEPVV